MSLDQLRVVRRVGQGSAGEILLVADDAGNEYALKKYFGSAHDPQIQHYERMGLPLQAVLHSSCPQIIQVHEWEHLEDTLYVKMEYVEGETLSRVLQHGSLSEKWAIDLAIQLCQILEVCHELNLFVDGRTRSGIAHGDLKPQNMRLEMGQSVRLAGYGMSLPEALDPTLQNITTVDLPFLSPERLEDGIIDVSSDLWSVGVILYKMVSGALPFFDESPLTLHRMIRRCRVPQLRKGSPAIGRLIYRALGPEAGRRFTTAGLFRAALEDVRTELAHLQRATDNQRQPPQERSKNPARRHERAVPVERPDRPEAKVIGFRSVAPGVVPGPAQAPMRSLSTEAGILPSASPASVEASPLRVGFTAVPTVEESSPAQASPDTTPSSPDAPSDPRPDQIPSSNSAARPRAASAPLSKFPSLPRAARIVGGVAAGLFIVAIIGQLFSWTQISSVQDHLDSSTVANVDESWSRYLKLQRFMSVPIGPGLEQVEEELKTRLLASAQTVFESYHEDIPGTRESNWREAESHLQSALQLSPNDTQARAMWYCSQGHVFRIEATSLDKRQVPSEAMIRRSEAVERFERAAALAPGFADPYLGLARIYSYDRFDLKGLEYALHEAERRGYNIGRRERAQLADAYYSEARTIYSTARKSTDAVRRRSDRTAAMTMAHRATKLYGEIPGFAQADRNKSATFELVQQIKKMPIQP